MHSQQEEAEPAPGEITGNSVIRLRLQKDVIATEELARLMRTGRDIRENGLSGIRKQ